MIESPENARKHELLQCFRRGWRHGACASAQDTRFTDHTNRTFADAYERGYLRGREAATLSATAECERLQYDATYSMLRSEPPTTPPEGA